MNVLVWLKRDLRLQDHPALTLAAALGPVLPVYVAEPELWAQPDASGRHWAFVAESLAGLRAEMAPLGLTLAVRCGDAVEVLSRLCLRHGIARIVTHAQTGNGWSRLRDRRVEAWARQAGIDWLEVASAGRAQPESGAAPLPLPQGLTGVPGVEAGQIPGPRALRLAEDRCPHRQQGGRAEGLRLLDSFLTTRGEGYRSAHRSALAGERAGSRLSPHFAFGTLSPREAAQAAAARQAERPGGQWRGALAAFQARLVLREQTIQRLADQPTLETDCLWRAAEGLRPRLPDADRLAAWSAGETGLPFLDACLRYLRATGWLNFRMRAVVMAAASQHLWLDWRATGPVLARLLTDYDPGLHWPQVQMQAGVAAPGSPRLSSPVKAGLELDPAGSFIRRWLPELAAVPDGFVHDPWNWPGFRQLAGRRYPEPIVDPMAAQRAASAAFAALRRAEGDRAPAPGRPPRRTRAPEAQMRLDL